MFSIFRSRRRTSGLLAFVAILAIGVIGIASADTVHNDVEVLDAAGDPADGERVLTVTQGDASGATVVFRITNGGGDTGDTTGQTGQNCNPAFGDSATLTLDLPAGATATPSSLN